MDFGGVNTFETDSCSSESDTLMMDLLDPSPPSNDFADGFIAAGIPMEGGLKDLELASILFPETAPVLDDPMMTMTDSGLGENIFAYSTIDASAAASPASDFFESAPASPFSPSTVSSKSSSSESGIEDDSDMEEQISTPPEYAVARSTSMSADTTNATSLNSMVSQSGCSSATSSALQKTLLARKHNKSVDECQISLTKAQQELRELLKNLISSSASQPAPKPSGIEPVQAQLVPNSSLSVTSSGSVPVITVPLTVQSSQFLPQTQSLSDPVSTLASVLTTRTATEAGLPGRIRSQGHSNKKAGKKIEEPKLVLLEEPEENYRARYESEGCRGPIHGSKENTFPTIQVTGYSGQVWISVHLVTNAGIPHYHSIHGPGSTKVPCKETTLLGEIPAVQVMVAPDTKMTAVLDSLSIRRLRNWEGDRELRKRGIDPRTWKKERKEARLLFQAEIPLDQGNQPLKLSCKSRIFQCSSSGPSGNPEIWWASLSEGSVAGGEELGLIGKKFQSGFKVRFFAELPSGHVWEEFAEVDKSKSHQGAAVVSTPAYCDLDIVSPVTVNVEVMAGSSRDPKCSEPVDFTYKPQVKVEPVHDMVACQGVTAQQDSNKQGGLVTTVMGGTNGVMMTSDFATAGNVLVGDQTPQLPEMAATSVLPALLLKADQNDWQSLAVQLKDFYEKGELTTQHIKDLCHYINRRDTLLLQAFRSARNAGTQDEFQVKFKQYLSGMLNSVSL